MVKRFISISLCIMALIALPLITGCGSGTKEGSTQVTVEEPGLTGVATCSNCHPIQTFDWKDGGHTNRNDLPTIAMIGAAGSSSECRECHDPNNEGPSMNEVLGGTFSSRPVNGCETCHGNGGNHFGLGPIAKYRVASSAVGGSQFNTCNTCHRLLDKTTGAPMPSGQHATNTMQLNHLATAGSWTGVGGVNINNITGYAIDPKNNHACSNCHNPHSVNLEINKQWTASGHADRTAAGPWAHYNWSQRPDCQRCHTTSGYAAFAAKNEAGKPYVAATDAPIKPNANWKPEMLACNGCHTTNYDGGLRNPKAITAPYTGADFTYPDIGNSNICMACHIGRESGDTVKTAAGDFSNKSFVNSHYLTAGGTLFSKTGYTYGDRNYDSAASGHVHDRLGVIPTGTAAADAFIAENKLENDGPCVVCHLTSEKFGKSNSHSFSPFTEYGANDIGLNPVCVRCHTTRGAGSNAKVAWFEGSWKLRSDAALEALKAQLALKGFPYTTEYPYFATKNWLSPGDTATNGSVTGKHNMGAAFNYNVLAHDPGAVVHNRYYVRRLVYDSIDWLDDNILNYSVGATLNALDPATTYKADAVTFLIKGGVPTGTATERY